MALGQSLKGRRIVVDAGHGTINFDRKVINSGKETYDGIPENQLTLQIAERLAKKLRALGAIVFETRTQKDYWRPSYNSVDDNRARAVLATELKAEVLLSIHCDWHPRRKVHGVTTLYEKPNSKRLGEIIHKNMVKTLKARDRRLVKDTFTILTNTDVPALIVETGFMSHRKEGRKLKTDAYQNKVVKALTQGLITYFKN